MLGPNAITNTEIQNSLKNSSYLDDIIFMGFIDDKTRDWLYKYALASVFPSKYEGFGLPVLEAMAYGCPVISYDNAATREVAGEAPIYAQNVYELLENIEKLLSLSEEQIKKLQAKGKTQAKKYNWSNTSAKILSAITKENRFVG